MASLLDMLTSDMKEAMRARDDVRLRSIRALRSALQSAEISKREGGTATLSEQEVLAVLQKQAKQRRDSIAQFQAAGRDDLVAREQEELAVIEGYLPKELTDDELRAELQALAAETGASSPADVGKLMKAAMAKLRGTVSGQRVQAMAKEILA